MTSLKIALVGNPNCGKTTLFNALTGARQIVGNWPGVTVEKKVGRFATKDHQIELVDLPGTYALSTAGDETSLDEKIARDFVLSGEAHLVINIVDASNIERNLYLTTQLLEMGVPMLVALNMVDIAKAHHIEIDAETLSGRLQCPVVPIVASTEKGIDTLKAEIARVAEEGTAPGAAIRYGAEIETAIAELAPLIDHSSAAVVRRTALELLEGETNAAAKGNRALAEAAETARNRIEDVLGYDADTAIASGRYDFVSAATDGVVRRTTEVSKTLSDRFDHIVLNRVLGIPIFLLVMYAMFMFTINIGGSFIDFFDIAGGTIFVDGFAHLLAAIGSPDWLVTLLATGIGGGIQTVATFVPVIAFLFLFLSVLEDSGYMARAAFVMDRFMRLIGLPGKSFVPLIVGFGCNVPSIMASRTLENERDRTMTIAMAPFMSCGARLPVYALFAAAFFPTGGQNLMFGLYLIGILAAVLTGLMLKKTLLPGETSPFVMELPPYHMPTLKGIVLRTWDRLKSFVLRAGKVIVGVVMVLAFLNSWGNDGSFGNEDTNASMLSEIGRTIAPIFAPMGIEQDNWPATVGVFTGILAKEAVVGTLNNLYAGLDEDAQALGDEAAAEPDAFDFWGGIGEAFTSIGDNLAGLADMAGDPLGISVGDVDNPQRAAEEQDVDVGIFGSMVALFDGQVGAFAYLLMVLLYMPCGAAIAAVYREAGWKWTGFVAFWTVSLGYGSAVLFYQAATIAQHPASSASWIVGVLAFFALTVAALRRLGPNGRRGGVAAMQGA